MTVTNLKDLEKLIKLCRKTGVDILKVDGIELVLGVEPEVMKASKLANMPTSTTILPGGIDENTPIDTPDHLSPEQLMFYSVGGQQPPGSSN